MVILLHKYIIITQKKQMLWPSLQPLNILRQDLLPVFILNVSIDLLNRRFCVGCETISLLRIITYNSKSGASLFKPHCGGFYRNRIPAVESF